MAIASEYSWKLLPNSPTASSRTDDIWFFDEQTGWLINSSGYVCKTENGGANWTPKFFLPPNLPSKPYLRCMGWGNEHVGWFGSVTNLDQYLDTLLHHTTDGGESWNPVVNLPQSSPPGICGFYAVNQNVAYGSGTNDPALPGPAIVKTKNGGSSWDLIPMSEYADNLIDIYFMDEDNGFVVGGKIDPSCPASNPYYPEPRLSAYVQLRPVVLRTTDGGKTWVNVAADTLGLGCGEWGWKIQFINDHVGVVSLESFMDAAILKTVDGGKTWERKRIAKAQGHDIPAINRDLEGVGFINEQQGWVGGWGYNFDHANTGLVNSYTADGGETWVNQDHVIGDPQSDPRIVINRYRLHGSLENGGFGYCSGLQVYKLALSGSKKSAFAAQTISRVVPAHGGETIAKESAFAATTVSAASRSDQEEAGFNLSYSVRKDGLVEVSYALPEAAGNLFIGLWNQFAFHIRTLVNEDQPAAGQRTVVWDLKDEDGTACGWGNFICRMSVGGRNGASQLIMLPKPV